MAGDVKGQRETHGKWTAVRGKLGEGDAREAYVLGPAGDGVTRPVASMWRWEEAVAFARRKHATERAAEARVPCAWCGLVAEDHTGRSRHDGGWGICPGTSTSFYTPKADAPPAAAPATPPGAVALCGVCGIGVEHHLDGVAPGEVFMDGPGVKTCQQMAELLRPPATGAVQWCQEPGCTAKAATDATVCVEHLFAPDAPDPVRTLAQAIWPDLHVHDGRVSWLAHQLQSLGFTTNNDRSKP